MTNYLDSNERTCACCGKRFMISAGGEWGWVYDTKLTCSYTCMRKLQAEDRKRLTHEADFKEHLKTASMATQRDIDRIIDMKERGYRLSQISSVTGFSVNAICILIKRKVPVAPGHRRSKITDEMAEEFVRLYQNGMTQREIAERYGIGHTTVCQAIARKLWG